MRLDKYLSSLGFFTRRQAKKYLKQGIFLLNGDLATDGSVHIQEGDLIQYGDHLLRVKFTLTLLLNKPAGYVSSDVPEAGRPSYQELLADCVYANMLHVAGRLDVDTEGLLLLTSDGQLAHRIISPKHRLEKVYLVHTATPLSDAAIEQLQAGVVLDDGYHTQPAKVARLDEDKIQLTLTEGKFHQVKRMLVAVDNEVVSLQRIQLGPWTLEGLAVGSYREATDAELGLVLRS